MSATAAEARGMMIPVPDEDGPGAPHPQSSPPRPPEPNRDTEGAAATNSAAPVPADAACHDDRCRRATVWHVTNRTDKSCLDIASADFAAAGDIAKLKSLLPAASFTITQGECAR